MARVTSRVTGVIQAVTIVEKFSSKITADPGTDSDRIGQFILTTVGVSRKLLNKNCAVASAFCQ